MNINSIFNDFRDFFRKKEYTITDYNTLNPYNIQFREIGESDLLKIKNVLLNFCEAEAINDTKLNLFSKNSIQFSDVDKLVLEIKNIILEDYRQTYFEAINENWNFNYYLSNSDSGDIDTLFIKNELKKNGSIVYAILAIKKFRNNYYLWNLLE